MQNKIDELNNEIVQIKRENAIQIQLMKDEMHMSLYSVLLQKNLIECVLSIGLYFRIIIKINNYILFSVYI